MPEIRRTNLCDVDSTAPFSLAKQLPRLRFIFDAFLAHVAETLPDLVDPLRDIATCKFRNLSGNRDDQELLAAFEDLLPALDELQRARLAYVIDLLDIRQYTASDEIETTRINTTRARLYPMYYQMLAFCELIGRREAIQFIEAYTDRWMAEQTTTDESLEDPGRFWDSLDGPNHETEEIAARLGRGKIAFRVEQCLWAKAMRPLEDPELAHAFTCYGDFPQIAAINPNFVLTRTMTLIQGAPYCDTCIHDRRHVDSVNHPSREFFDSLAGI